MWHTRQRCCTSSAAARHSELRSRRGLAKRESEVPAASPIKSRTALMATEPKRLWCALLQIDVASDVTITSYILKTENLTRYCDRLVAFGLHVPELLDRYADRAEELAAQLQPNQFGLILNAFARASHRHEKMLKSFSKRMMPRLPQFVPVDISRTCGAYSKLREHDEARAADATCCQPRRLISNRCCSGGWPLKCRTSFPFLKDSSWEWLRMLMLAWTSETISFSMISRTRLHDSGLLQTRHAADGEVLRRPHELNHVTLLLLANAFAHFKIRHTRLWPVLAEWLLQAQLDFQAQDVGTVLNALSAVDFLDEALLRSLLVSLSEEPLLSEATPATLCTCLDGRLRRPQWGDVEAVLCTQTSF
eukprot:s699_g8.t1